jgi:hypothetical protein
MKHLSTSIAVLAICAGLATSHPALAGERIDHDRALQLLESGKILPLSEILLSLMPKQRTRVLDLELEEDDGLILYEITTIDENGRKIEQVFDASTGELIETEWLFFSFFSSSEPSGSDGSDGEGSDNSDGDSSDGDSSDSDGDGDGDSDGDGGGDSD